MVAVGGAGGGLVDTTSIDLETVVDHEVDGHWVLGHSLCVRAAFEYSLLICLRVPDCYKYDTHSLPMLHNATTK